MSFLFVSESVEYDISKIPLKEIKIPYHISVSQGLPLATTTFYHIPAFVFLFASQAGILLYFSSSSIVCIIKLVGRPGN
jgi:hypothetical protein